MNKISIQEYMENESLLEIIPYLPHVIKIDIIDSILKQVIFNDNSFYTLDSVILDRIKKQIYISTYTNIDMHTSYENLEAFDVLVCTKKIDEIFKQMNDEYNRLEEILNLRINDYIRDKSSLRFYIHNKTKYILEKLFNINEKIVDKINNIDFDELIKNTVDVTSYLKNDINGEHYGEE